MVKVQLKNKCIISVALIFLFLNYNYMDLNAASIMDVATSSDASEESFSGESEKKGDLDYVSTDSSLYDVEELSENKTEDRIHYLRIKGNSDDSNDAILIESNGHYGMIDSSLRFGNGGFESPVFEGSGYAVLSYLEALGVKHLDFFLATHSHSDHIGGIYDIVNGSVAEGGKALVDENTTYIRKSYTDNPSENSYGWRNGFFYDEAEKAMNSATKLLVDKHDNGLDKLGAVFNANGQGDIDDTISFSFYDYNIFLYNLYPRSNEIENANTIVTYIEKGDIKTVLTGDINVYNSLEQDLSKAIVSQHGKITVMKVPHHGWCKSTSKEMIDTLGACWAILSTNYSDSSWYSPFYGYMKQKKMKIYRTMDVQGNALVQDMTNNTVSLQTGRITDESGVNTVSFNEYVKEWAQSGTPRWDKWWNDWDSYYTVYVNQDGTNKTGWNKIGKYNYYFDSSGIMKTGWISIGTKRAYLRDSQNYGHPLGSAVTGWDTINGVWYYFDNDGMGFTGWNKRSGNWYYIDNGLMNTQKVRTIDGEKYYFESDGKLKTGWINRNGAWFYLDSKGKIYKGWIKTASGWYYTNVFGEMLTSQWVDDCWLGSDGRWSYSYKGSWNFNHIGWWYEDSSGWYPKSQWQKINGKSYYFEQDGYMAVNQWVNGQWIDGNGYTNYKYKGSWHISSKGWWYGDTSGWYAKDCWQKINGSWYYFDYDGYMVTDTVVEGYEIGSDGICK